jgi:predicted transcriptional regulator of viral defense system
MKAEEISQSPGGANQRSRALALLKSKGMLRLKDFAERGIGAETVARLLREKAVIRRARGLYQLPEAELEATHTLAEAGLLVPKGIVCLTSALEFHGLTLQMPSAVWMAIERTAWRPKIKYPMIRFVRWSAPALQQDIVKQRIEGVDVRLTKPAKTIGDCFRYRNKIGIDVALEALRQRRVTPDELWERARAGRVWSVMKPYLDATVSRHDLPAQHRCLRPSAAPGACTRAEGGFSEVNVSGAPIRRGSVPARI